MGRWGDISVEATLHPGHRGALLGQGVRSTEEGWEGCWGKQQELLRAGQLGPRGSHV